MRYPGSAIGMLMLFVTLSSCTQERGATFPALPDAADGLVLPTAVAQLGAPIGASDATYFPAALWNLDIDAANLAASVEQPQARSAAASGETFLLDISRFFTQSPMQVTSVERLDDALRVRYTITHPLAAPDPDRPSSATNRADLGIAGLTLFLLEAPTTNPRHFAETDYPVRASTNVLLNPDGYFAQGGLITGLPSGQVFPFRRLVDDSGPGSRLGHPNDLSGIGNFGAQSGWQRYNWGDDRASWTGFGVLHAGQTSANHIDLSLTSLASGSLSLQVALIAKWINPVGGQSSAERIANRLPPAIKDPGKFLYRMPQGAWDLEQVVVEAIDGELQTANDASVILHLHVTDWDARAEETTQQQIIGEPNASLVGRGQAGLPNVAISIPDLPGFTLLGSMAGTEVIRNNDSAYGGDPGIDSGRADDPLYYRVPLSRSGEIPISPGLYPGLLHVIDPAASLKADTSLNANLNPISSTAPRIETYQAFEVMVAGPPPQITVEFPYGTPSGSPLSLRATTPEPGGLRYKVDWNADGDLDDPTESTLLYAYGNYYSGPEKEINTTLIPRNDSIILHLRRAGGGLYSTLEVPFTVGPNEAPYLGASPPRFTADILPSPAEFQLVDMYVSDPEGDPFTFTITNDLTSDVITGTTLPQPVTFAPVTNPPHSLMNVSITLNDALHPGESGRLLPVSTLRIQGPDDRYWAKGFGDYVTEASYGGVGADALGNSYIGSFFNRAWDFGGGLLIPPSEKAIVLASYGPTGELRWTRVFDAGGSGILSYGMDVNASGTIVIAGTAYADVDFGGGVRTISEQSLFVARYNSEGTWLNDYVVPWLASWDYTNGYLSKIAIADSGAVLCFGRLRSSGTIDLGGGPRTYAGTSPAFVVGLDSNSNHLWDRIYQDGTTIAFDVAASADGSFLIAGRHMGNVDYGGGVRSVEEGSAHWMLLLDSDGGYRWDKVMTGIGLGRREIKTCDFTGPSPGVIAAGHDYSTTDLGSGPTVNGGFLVQYDIDGTWQWERSRTGTFRDLSCDPTTGDIYAVGFITQDTDLGLGVIEPIHDFEIVAASYASDGTPRWVDHFVVPVKNGGLSHRAFGNCIDLMPDSGLLLGGRYTSDIDLDPGPGRFIMPRPYTATDPGFLVRLNRDTGQF